MTEVIAVLLRLSSEMEGRGASAARYAGLTIHLPARADTA